MKLQFSLLFLLISTSFTFAQSPSTFYSTGKRTQTTKIVRPTNPEAGAPTTHVPPEAGAPAPNNPWMVAGIQAGYSFNGGSFENNFQASGRAILEVLGKKDESENEGNEKFHLFLMGNLSRITSQRDADNEEKLKELQQSTQGINIGLFPHYILFGEQNDFSKPSLTLYAPLTYKVNAFESNNGEKSTIYLNQFRAAAGAEISFLPGTFANLPCTFSIEPALTFFNKNDYAKIFNKDKYYLPSLEATLIIPAGVGRGIMFVYSTSREKSSQFMAGIVLVGSKN